MRQLSREIVKLADTVVALRVFLGEFVAPALLRYSVDQHRGAHISCPADNGLKLCNIVTVNGTEVVNTHGVEDVSRQDAALERFLDLVVCVVKSGDRAEGVAVPALKVDVSGLYPFLGQQPCHTANVAVYGHTVVVQYDDHGFAAAAEV